MRLELDPGIVVPEWLASEVCFRLPWVDERIGSAEVVPGGGTITLTLRRVVPKEELGRLEHQARRLVRSMVEGARSPRVEIHEEHRPGPAVRHRDPLPELLARHEAARQDDGVYTLGPLPSRVAAWFDRRFEAIAEALDAPPYRVPALISAAFLERVRYFRSFPHSLSFATHLREDLDVLEAFPNATCCADGALDSPPEAFAAPRALLAPAVCYHLYHLLADGPVPGGRLAATAVGPCFRYEGRNLRGLERLWSFTMREIVFVGPEDWVVERRERARELAREVFHAAGLHHHVETAHDPFFVGEFRRQAAFQTAFRLKLEVRADLPYRHGDLAVGSFNVHQDFFGRHAGLTLPDGAPAWTGCAAFGLERLALAFLAQHGLDPAGWPEAVREAIG